MSDEEIKKTGGSAFPVIKTTFGQQYEPNVHSVGGMTMRDYFAAEAMKMKWSSANSTASIEDVAAWCYQLADAMIAERAQP